MNWNNFANTLIAGLLVLFAAITACFAIALMSGVWTAFTVWGTILGALAITSCFAIANGMGWMDDANGK